MRVVNGFRHLVKCRCFLPQFRELEDPPLHEFPVFSIVESDDEIEDSDNVIVKYSQCPNCGIIHKVIDICESIVVDKENLSSIVTVDDVKVSLDEKLIEILEKYESDIAKWEHAKFIIENELWGSFINLTSETDRKSGLKQGKYIKFLKLGLYTIEPYARDEIVSI